MIVYKIRKKSNLEKNSINIMTIIIYSNASDVPINEGQLIDEIELILGSR